MRTPDASGCILVLIADDHGLVPQGLITVLKGEPSIEVIGEASDGIEAVDLALSLRPDVIVTDVSMPRMNGIDATRQILSERPEIGIVGLSMHDSDEIASSMREAGAVDFVTKGGRSDRLVSAIRAAGRRGTGIPSR